MKKQNATFLFQVENTIPIVIGSCNTLKNFKVDDIIVFNPSKKRSLYFQVQEISEDSPENLEIIVRYFGCRKVMQRATIYNASIIPFEGTKLNYSNIVNCMLYSE